MAQWHFNFGHLNDFDGLVNECLNRVPQYRQVYPAPRADVSESLEQMISEGFPPNQNIVWHKTTHGQKRYYWIKKSNDDDEVRVKVGGGVFGKADRDLRILTSTNECRKIARQFLVRWNENGVLPGWKTMWSIFDVANYDVGERRIKFIHKIIHDNVIREALGGGDIEDFNIESIEDSTSYGRHSDAHNQNHGNTSASNQNDNSYDVKQSSISNQADLDQAGIIPASDRRQAASSNIPDSVTDEEAEMVGATLHNQISNQHTATSVTAAPVMTQIEKFPLQSMQPNTIRAIRPDDSEKENSVLLQASDVCQAQYKHPNPPTTCQESSFLTVDNVTPSSTHISTSAPAKKKRQRRIYNSRDTPYVTRRTGAVIVKTNK